MAKDKVVNKPKTEEITDWEDVPITDWEDVPANGEDAPVVNVDPENDPIPALGVKGKRQNVIGAINEPFNTINKSVQQKYPKLSGYLGKSGMNMAASIADILASPVTMATSGAYKAINTAETPEEYGSAAFEFGAGVASAPFIALNPLVRGGSIGVGELLKASPENVQKTVSAPIQTIAGKEGGGYETADRALQFGLSLLGNKLPKSIGGETRSIPQKIGGLNVETVSPVRNVGEIVNTRGQKQALKNFFRANEPAMKDLGYKDHFKEAQGFIKKTEKANPTGKAPKGEMARRGYENIKKSASDYYEEYVQPQIDRQKPIGARVDTKSAAESMKSTISKTDEIGNASKLAAIDEFVKKTPESMTVAEASDFAKALKKETKAYQSATDVERNAMVAANPLLEAKIAFLHKLQDNIAGTLESFGEKNVKKTVKTYGSIAYLRDKAFENVIKSEIEFNEPFIPPLSKAGAISDMANKVLGNTKEKQMRRAMEGIAKYAPEPEPPFTPDRPEISGLLEDPTKAKSPTNYPVGESLPTTPIGGPATPWEPTILPYEPVNVDASPSVNVEPTGMTLGGKRKTAEILSEGSPISIPEESGALMDVSEAPSARQVLPKRQQVAPKKQISEKASLEWKQLDNDNWTVKVGDKQVKMAKSEISTPKETEAAAVQKAENNIDVVDSEVAAENIVEQAPVKPEESAPILEPQVEQTAKPVEQRIIDVAQERNAIVKKISNKTATDEDVASFRSLTDQLRDLQIEKLRVEKEGALSELRKPGASIDPAEAEALLPKIGRKK